MIPFEELSAALERHAAASRGEPLPESAAAAPATRGDTAPWRADPPTGAEVPLAAAEVQPLDQSNEIDLDDMISDEEPV